MIVEIRGNDLPGRSCGPSPEGGQYENIHVGLARRTETVELVPGDASAARWEFEIVPREGPDGMLDFGGPFVLGRRGERHLGLRWVTVEDDGHLAVFRAAKLRLDEIDPVVLRMAVGGGRLVAALGLTDEHGWPRCATVHPPFVLWSGS